MNKPEILDKMIPICHTRTKGSEHTMGMVCSDNNCSLRDQCGFTEEHIKV